MRATMRAAMRASALFVALAAGVRSGCWPADLAGVSDPSPGREPHDRAPELMADADMAPAYFFAPAESFRAGPTLSEWRG